MLLRLLPLLWLAKELPDSLLADRESEDTGCGVTGGVNSSGVAGAGMKGRSSPRMGGSGVGGSGVGNGWSYKSWIASCMPSAAACSC